MTDRDAGDRRLLLHAYMDGELDAVSTLAMERRLAEDPALAAEHARYLALRQAMRERLPRETAPAGLRAKISAIGGEPSDVVVLPKRRAALPVWMAMAATLLVGLGLGSGSTWLALQNTMPETAFSMDSAVAGHIRALAAGMPFDVASSDRHTVKPWFAGKLTFAPVVLDLADVGFPLAGGRLDVIDGRRAATLVFRHGKHLLSLTEAFDPDGRLKGSYRGSRDGFSVVRWWENGLAYYAVSDAELDEVDAFAAAFRAKAKA
jgi:anti-sigma factor RsiW